MDTAGKAVLFSGLTVLISLTAVMLVPSPAFRSMALGIMLSVIFILAATLTLLPAVLAKLGPSVDKGSPAVGALRRAPLARASPPGPSACGGGRSPTARSPSWRCSRSRSRCSTCRPACRRSRSSPTATARAPATTRSSRRSGPVRPARCRSSRPPRPSLGGRGEADARRGHRAGRAAPAGRSTGWRMIQAIPTGDPSGKPLGATIDRLRDAPAGGHARRRRRRREPRPRGRAVGQDAARHRRRARARLPAAARRTAGAAAGRGGRAHQSAGDRCRVRGRAADLPAGPSVAACWASSPRASSTRGRRCSSSRWCSRSRWTTRSFCCPAPRSTGTAPTIPRTR